MVQPKPLVEFANKTVLEFQIEALVAAGVTEVILAIGFQKEILFDFAERLKASHKIKITMSVEDSPLGVAGPMKLAEQVLTSDNPSELFFLCNSDVMCEFPFERMIQLIKSKGSAGVMCVAQVAEPSKYGVVASDAEDRIVSFHEKPKSFIGDCVNAGVYLFQTKVLARLSFSPLTDMVQFLEALVRDRELFSLRLTEYWMDIGQPADYLKGTELYLEYLRKTSPQLLAAGEGVIGNVLVHPTAIVHADSVIGPNVCIGAHCTVEQGVRLRNTCLFSGSRIGKSSYLSEAIISWKSKVGAWTRIEGLTVIAEDCTVADELMLSKAMIFQRNSITQSTSRPGLTIL
jgi:mannose-1-phosphate guanylyltransferase